MDIPTLLSLAAWIVTFGITLWGTWYSLRQFRKNHESSEGLPDISVLKPVKGLDADLELNLRSFFALGYPTFELIFAVADSNDAAIPLIRSLMAEHPSVETSLIVGAEDVGPNPKVNNLVRPYAAARHEVVLVSDSNVRVPVDYLRRVVAYLKPNVGIVTAVVAGRAPSGVGGALEATYLNSFYARWMHITCAFGLPTVVGKSMLFRKAAMEKIGGLAWLGRYIAEDYMAGQAMRRSGYEIALMAEPIQQHLGIYSFRSFWERHLRWGRMRKQQAPLAFLLEPLFMSFGSGALGAIAISSATGMDAWAVFGTHVTVWMAADLLLMRRLEHRLQLRMLPSWILREALSFPLWLHMLSGTSVNWRGTRLRILPGGLLAEAAHRRWFRPF